MSVANRNHLAHLDVNAHSTHLVVYLKSITKLLDEACRPWQSRGLGAQPARPGRPCWLDLASIGSLWLPLAPLLARFGLVWLDLAAPAALAGSIWLLCALLGAPAGSIWLPTTTPSTRLAKKNDLLIDDPASMLPASCALERFFMPQI